MEVLIPFLVYNANVPSYDTLVQTFPSLIIAASLLRARAGGSRRGSTVSRFVGADVAATSPTLDTASPRREGV